MFYEKIKKAFTLVELMIVVAIIAIITTIVVLNYQRSEQASQFATLKADMVSSGTALELYYNNYSKYPVSSDLMIDSSTFGGAGNPFFNGTAKTYSSLPSNTCCQSIIYEVHTPPTYYYMYYQMYPATPFLIS